ncbi:MAG: iron ABC transporter permease [Candidatus Sericytochromatia bacterium]|nr:iron ABC transporter permease [Candidatus Sericytochromatia bacterium]
MLTLLLGWLVVAGCAVAVGAVPLGPEALRVALTGGPGGATEGTAAILWQIRLPRVVMGTLAGAGLAIAGAAWQGVLRNPLADPYLVGASAGAAVGAAAALLFGIGGGASLALPLLAFGGSLAAVGVVYKLAAEPGRPLAVERLLLAGVAVSSLLSAVLSLLMLLRQDAFTQLYLWLIGGLAGRGWEHVGLLAAYGGLAVAGLVWWVPRLNLLQLGEQTARSLGVDHRRDPQILVGLAALLTAAVVSVCGMIGFLGLVVPHLARLLAGPDLRRALPVAALLGAILLTAGDLAARTLWAPVEIPVGVLTALLGAPFFLYLLARRDA